MIQPRLRSAALAVLAVLSCSAVHAAEPQKWDNAPLVVPNTTEAMQSPAFWIGRLATPDRVILTPADIERLNERNRGPARPVIDIDGKPVSIEPVIQSKLAIGLQYNVEQPLELTTFPGDSLRAMLERHLANLTGRTWYDRRQMKWPPEEIDRLAALMNIDTVPDVVQVRHGILTVHTLNRAVPTEQPGYGGETSWLDSWQSTSLDVAMPVAVLHASPDNTWYYVRSEIAFGWVPARNVALGDRRDLARYDGAKDFIVATAHTVPVYADDAFTVFIDDLYLGSRVKLDRRTEAGYQVSMPFRGPDGSFQTVPGWVKPDATVHVGYQSFTQRNVIETFFRLLYRPYGWADSNHERDCCGTVRTVLRTFGIKTGRWTTFELYATDHVHAFPRDTPKERKYEILDTCEPGVCLVGNSGHVCLYIGEVDGRHYVIHQGGYSYTDAEGIRRHFRRVNVNDTELEGGSNIDDFTEITELKP